jgi:hypothetical protein
LKKWILSVLKKNRIGGVVCTYGEDSELARYKSIKKKQRLSITGQLVAGCIKKKLNEKDIKRETNGKVLKSRS